MLICLCGHEYGNTMGNLKTYFMTTYLYSDFLNGRNIYANYKLNFKYTPLNSLSNLMEVVKKNPDVTIGVDELSVYIDNYTKISSKNKNDNPEWKFKNFARQTRKRTVKLIYTAQTFSDAHKSLRKITTHIYLTRKLHYNMNECCDEFCHKPHILEICNGKTGKIKYYKVNINIFDLYDTNEIIEIGE